MAVTHLNYRPDVDGLRAIAVVAVVAFHAFPNVLPSGFIGVDIFFVISGFLITGIILNGLQSGTFDLVNFYVRRIRRIVPALILVLAACLFLGWLVLLSEEYKNLGRHVSVGSLFLSNFWLWHEAGYFDETAEFKPLLHLWSLGIEEQFYVIWPAVVLACWRYCISLVWPITTIIILTFAFNVFTIDQHPVMAFYSPMTRFWELMLGALLTQLSIGNQATQRAASWHSILGPDTWAAIGGGFLVAGFVLVDKTVGFPGFWALLPTLGAFALVAAGPTAWINRNILARPILVGVGLISYPLYLWHWPLLSLARIVEGGVVANVYLGAAIVLSVALAWATYLFFERPIRASRRFAVPATLCVVLGAYVVVGQVVYKSGFPQRFADSAVPVERYLPTTSEVDDCRKQLPFALGLCVSYPTLLDPDQPTVFSIGDSHGGYLARGMYSVSRAEGVSLQFAGLSAGSCLAFLGVERYSNERSLNCQEIFRPAIDFAIGNPNIKAVMLVGRYSLYLSSDGFGIDSGKPPGVNHIQFSGPRLPPSQVDYRATFEMSLRNTLDALNNAGKQVLFVQQVPELGFDPRRCARPFRLSGIDACRIPRNAVDARQASYRQIVQLVVSDYENVSIFDPLDFLCDEDYCYGVINGSLIYRDHHHLNPRGMEFLAKKIISKLKSHISPR